MSRLVWAATILACDQALAQPPAPLTGCAAKQDRIETELAQARAQEGDADDIAKAGRELREAQQDLDNARAELTR